MGAGQEVEIAEGAGTGAASIRSAGRTNASVPTPDVPTRDPWPSMNCMMSCLVMRPPSPVPETWDKLTPCSRAILRTNGEERASSSSS